jgi:hypothetical protein
MAMYSKSKEAATAAGEDYSRILVLVPIITSLLTVIGFYQHAQSPAAQKDLLKPELRTLTGA